MLPKILREDGTEVLLNERESLVANYVQKQVNALGFDVPITTMTTVIKKISEQKFYEIAFAEYLPVRVGQGAWSDFLTTYRSFDLSGSFEDGIVQTGTDNARLAQGDAGVDAINVLVKSWAKATGWNLMQMQQAAKNGNWDLVAAKEAARKKNWDLGLQKLAFLGIANDANVKGLLNLSGVTTNTTALTQSITSLATTPQNLSNFIARILNDYRSNCNRSAWPSHFIIPESDYLGLATPSSAQFPIKSILQLMQETFQTMTKNPNFEILPLVYGDAQYNLGAGINKQCYVLLNYNEESLRMDIPVDYTPTLANSIDNFSFQNAAYGQFTGVGVYRPLEVYYYQY